MRRIQIGSIAGFALGVVVPSRGLSETHSTRTSRLDSTLRLGIGSASETPSMSSALSPENCHDKTVDVSGHHEGGQVRRRKSAATSTLSNLRQTASSY